MHARLIRENLLQTAVKWPVLVVAVCLLVTGCVSNNDTAPPATYDPRAGEGESILPMTITEWLFAPDVPIATGDPAGVTHLSISPMAPGENEITIELTDLEGQPQALPDANVTLQHRPMTPGGAPTEVELAPVSDQSATWSIDALALPDQGWYAIDVILHHDDTVAGTSTFYLLLPDPSVYGADSLDLPESDPDAEALYLRALDAYGSWETGRWRESLGSGTDVVVISRFALTSRPGEPPASELSSVYAGSFRTRPDGTEPDPPRQDFSSRITIGDQSWVRQGGDAWERMPSLETATWEERADIYSGATNIQPGGTETIDGVETQIITFYLPQKGGQSEAWFAWWINPETGDPLRMVMVARMHFMVWDIYDINAPITISPPPQTEVATPSPSP